MADNLFIQVIARLNKALSKAKIQADIKNIEKTPFYVRLTGRLNKSLTRKNIKSDAQNAARNVNIDINARISERDLQRSLNEARQNLENSIQNNPIDIPVNVDVDTEGMQQGQQQIERQARGFRGILRDYLGAQAIFNKVTEATKKAVGEVEELNKAQTDLQIVTQKSASEMKALMQNYNQLAKDMSSTTLDIVESADQWLRQGKSISETNELIQDSVILSKIGQIESAEATEYLTSAMNGFHVASENAIGIIDKLSAVDLNAAVSSGGLAEAMSKCSNSANIAGVSMDSLIGYIGTVAEVTQKSDSVIGESFKTIMARMGKIKLNDWIDEDGTDISGEINDVEKTLGKFGISLRENATEFRNFENVIYDVGKAWNQFSSVDKNAIANAFGGVYQRENVLTLFENFDRALELTEVSANSAGTAIEKFSIYEQSLEAATNRLTASLEGLAYNTIDSEFLTGLTNATAGIVEFIDKTQLLKTGLTAGIFTGVISGLVALGTKMVAVKNNVVQFSQAMNLSRSSTAVAGTQYVALRSSVGGLTEAQLRLVLSNKALNEQQRLDLMQAAGIEQSRQRQLLQTWNLTNATNAQTAATFSLRGAWEGLKASLISNPIGLIVTALTLATTAIMKFNQKQEEARQEIKDTANKTKELTDNINSLYQAYSDMKIGVDNGTNSKEELTDATNDLLKALGYESDAIDDLIDKYGTLDIAINQTIADKLKNSLPDLANALKVEQDELLGIGKKGVDGLSQGFGIKINDENAELIDFIKSFNKNNGAPFRIFNEGGKFRLFSDDVNSTEGLKEQLDTLNLLRNALFEEYGAEGVQNIDLYNDLTDRINVLTPAIEEYTAAQDNLNKTAAQAQIIQSLIGKEIPKTVDEYRAYRQEMINTAKESGLFVGSQDDIVSAIDNTLASMNEFEKIQKRTNNLNTANKMFTDKLKNAKPVSDYLNSLSDEDLAIAIQIPNLFQNGLDGASKLIEDWKKDPKNKIDADVDTSSLEELKEAYEELSKSASNYSKNQKTLASALEEQEKHGQLSASTIQELTEAGYAQALVTEKETGKVTLNVNAYNRLNKAKKESLILEAEQQKSELEEKFKDEEKAISDLIAEMQYANAERRTAIALEMQQHGLTMSDIAEEMSKLDGMVASLSAPEFDTDKGDSSDDWKTEAESKIAEIQHLEAMGEINHDEYINRLEELNQKYYANNTKYLDDFNKYEEEIYKARKENEQDLFEQKIENYETLADKALDDKITDFVPKATAKLKEFNEEMQKTYGLGNVDLTKRPKVSAETMRKAGYESSDGETATVYSSFELLWQGDEENGEYVAVHYTPILPDGTVLDEDALRNYLYNTLEGSQDVLSADNLGIVLKVDTGLDISEDDMKSLETDNYTQHIQDVIKACDEWDIALHEVQEQWMELDNAAEAGSDITKFDYARSQINAAIEETEKRIAELKASGRQDVDDEIKELQKDLEGLYDSLDKINDSEIDFDVDKMNERIDGLEKTAEKISETSMLPDGTKLSTQEKFREIAAIYTEARYAIEDEINRIVQAGVEGHEDTLKELEEQSEAYTKEIENNFKDAVEAEKDFWEKAKDASNAYYDEQIDKVKEQQEASEKAADAEIDAVQAKIDALKKVNDEKQQEYELEEKKQNLEKASQKTRMVIGSDGRIEYRADDEAVREAQKSLDDLLLEKQVNSLENQKTVLEEMRDKESESYDTLIADIESQKEQDERQFDSLLQYLDNYLNPTGDTSNADVWSAIAKVEGGSFQNGKFVDKDGKLYSISELTAKYQKQIEADNESEKPEDNDKGKDKNAGLNASYSRDDVKIGHGNINQEIAIVEKMLGLKPGDLNKVGKSILASTQYINPLATQLKESLNNTVATATNNIVNNNTTPVNLSIGDIVINKPVSNVDDLAKQIELNLPNVIDQRIYTNIKMY